MPTQQQETAPTGRNTSTHPPKVVVLTYERDGKTVTEHLVVGAAKDQVKAIFLVTEAAEQAPSHLKREKTPANTTWRKKTETERPAPLGKEAAAHEGMRTKHGYCYWVNGVLYCEDSP